MTKEKTLKQHLNFLKDFETLENCSKIDSMVPNRIFKDNWELFDFHYDWEEAINPISKINYRIIKNMKLERKIENTDDIVNPEKMLAFHKTLYKHLTLVKIKQKETEKSFLIKFIFYIKYNNNKENF